jgi:hypothetical protein
MPALERSTRLISRPRVELLWFQDCPNHESARLLLEEVLAQLAPDTTIEDVDATDPGVAQRHRFPGSPIIRIDGPMSTRHK